MVKVKKFHGCDEAPKAVDFELTKKEYPEWPDLISLKSLKKGTRPSLR